VNLPFGAMMELEAHGPDTYVGTGPTYPWEGLYGGQIVAQALRSAELTVKPGHVPHSLHAYFLRVGDAEEPVRFEVERLRDGRTFVARQVVARQSTGAILNMSASFQAQGAPTMDIQLAQLPAVGQPEDAKDVSWSPLFELRLVQGTDAGATDAGATDAGGSGWGGSVAGEGSGGPARGGGEDLHGSCSWIKWAADLGEEQAIHAAALAYASDSGPAWIAESLHAAEGSPAAPWRPVSLDHAIWFHRPFRCDRWLLVEASTGSLHQSRGLTQGRVFSRDGALVASVAQEVFLRRPRPELP
jgi:acyl-CoA thioesterase-2